jgi:hypothetical protein
MVVWKRTMTCAAVLCALSSAAFAQGKPIETDGQKQNGALSFGGAWTGGGVAWSPDRPGMDAPGPLDGWSIGVARTQWVETRLPLFPKNLVDGNLRPRQSFATTFIATKPFGTLDIAPNAWWGVSGIGVEAEGTLSIHDGLQDHVEGTAGVMLRSPKAEWDGVGAFGLGWSNGLSYAFTDPAFERGPSGVRGLDTERLQYYMGFEATFSPEAAPNLEIFGRLHHRSGIYGVISPDDTGSNMLGGGVRLNF